jgi:hypothetical protein
MCLLTLLVYHMSDTVQYKAKSVCIREYLGIDKGPVLSYCLVQEKIMPDQAESKSKRSVHRSPGYPMFSLRDAIEKTKVIYANEKRSYTTPDVVAKHLGFSQSIGGPGGRSISALRQYGLLDEVDGKCRLSDSGYTLVQYPADSAERIQAIKAAIRKPTLFNELLDEYKDGLPSEETLRSNLLKRGFNPAVIPDVIGVFRDTIALDSSQNVEYSPIQVGDYVQWESQGAEQFDKPKRISKLSDDGKFAFVDGSHTGMPIEQLTKHSAPPEERENGGKFNRVPPKPGMNSDVFTLKEGDVVLQWPSAMSSESYQDFKDWIELMTRKARRSVVEKREDAPSE